MSDWQRPLKPGDGAIPATAFNAAVQGGMLALRAKGGVRRGAMGPGIKQPATELLVKWTGTEALPEFSVVTYAGGTVISQVDKPFAVSRTPVYEGGTPADSGDAFAILLEPARANGFARAVSMGHAVVDIDITDEDHTHANATPGETLYLTSGTSGRAEIIAKPAGTGVLRCTVLIGGGGGAGGCEGSVCTDYWAAHGGYTGIPGGLFQGGQTQIIYETATEVPEGIPVVVQAAILAGPGVHGFPAHATVWGRLTDLDSNGNPYTFKSAWVPLGHYRNIDANAGGTNSYDPLNTPSGPALGPARQGSIGIRRTFGGIGGTRLAWEITMASGSAANTLSNFAYVYGIGAGPTYIIVMTGCGSCDPALPTVTVPTPPPPPPPPSSIAVSFQARPTAGFGPLAVTFTDTTTGDPISWVWDFGDGKAASTQHTSYTYGIPGTYTVTLTATNAAGDSGSASVQIIVYDKETAPVGTGRRPLKAALRSSKATGGAPLAVEFGNDSTGGVPPIAYKLVYGDGDADTATDSLTPHTYADPGSYTATLIATDAAGAVSVSAKTIVVETAEFVGDGSLTASFSRIISGVHGGGTDVTHTDTSGTTGAAITSWAWTFGDGGTSTAQNPVHTYATAGTYTAVLTIGNGDDIDVYEQDITIS